MGKIVIHIPGFGEKRSIYTAENISNAAAQAGQTFDMAKVKAGRYGSALGSAPIVLDPYFDQLRTDGSHYDNNLLLRTADMKTVIEIIDARIDVDHQNDIKSTALAGRRGSVKEFVTRVVKDYESFAFVAKSLGEELVLSEEEAREVVAAEAAAMYSGMTLRELTAEEKYRLAARIHQKYGMAPEPLAQALGLRERVVRQVLTSKDFGIRRAFSERG